MTCEETGVVICNRAIDFRSVGVNDALDVEGVKGSTVVTKRKAGLGLEGPPCGVDVGCKNDCRQEAYDPC